jgi:hypothetical protein
MVTYNANGQKINSTVENATNCAPVNSAAISIPVNSAVQERMRELREKEAAAKADAELLQQKLVEGIKREVETKAVEWEADLLFEIEKTPGFTIWLRKNLQSPSAVQEASLAIRYCRSPRRRKGPDGNDEFYIPVLTLYEIAQHVIAGKEIPAAYTLENERMRLRHRIMANVIDSIKQTIQTEKLAEEKRLAEVARIAAEEKAAAYEAWIRRRQAVLDRYADSIRSNMKTPYHSFTGVEFSNPFVMYVRYNSVSNILTMEYLRIDASDTKINNCERIACPPTMKAPIAWNDMFEKGRLPFLTCCPVCSAQVSLSGITGNGQVGGICCEKSWDHYRWHSTTNTHIKQNKPWDPRDPDGSIAAAAARAAKIAAKEAEIAKLQAELEVLRRT